MKKRYYKVLTIAGSDSGGGAGVQADLKTFAALGCYGLSAVTALTAQNTKGVLGIFPVPAEFVQAQIEAVLSDMGVDAVKTGMLYSSDLIEAVSDGLQKFQVKNIVVDPLFSAHSGDKLLVDRTSIDAIKERLMPLASVITPNIPEAEAILNKRIQSLTEMQDAARALSSYGCENILIKGGHLEGGGCNDVLFIKPADRFIVFEGERIRTRNHHGTGCTLSSAIAAYLARGHSIEEAVKSGKTYITEAIRWALNMRLVKGMGLCTISLIFGRNSFDSTLF